MAVSQCRGVRNASLPLLGTYSSLPTTDCSDPTIHVSSHGVPSGDTTHDVRRTRNCLHTRVPLEEIRDTACSRPQSSRRVRAAEMRCILAECAPPAHRLKSTRGGKRLLKRRTTAEEEEEGLL